MHHPVLAAGDLALALARDGGVLAGAAGAHRGLLLSCGVAGPVAALKTKISFKPDSDFFVGVDSHLC
jgi:hypothetical protein